MVFSCTLFITFFEESTMMNATGITHTAAIAIFQLKKNRLITTMAVDISDPTSSGIQWEDAVSMMAQSLIMVLVRSARSFLPKKESGIFRSFSARVRRLTPLST